MFRRKKVHYVEELASKFEMTRFLDGSIRELSRGEARQLFIIRALVSHPRMILLDEFLSELDAAAHIRVSSIIQEIAQSGNCGDAHFAPEQ